MTKRSLYLIAAIAALLIVVVSIRNNQPAPQAANPIASPTNGLIGGTTAEAVGKRSAGSPQDADDAAGKSAGAPVAPATEGGR